MKPKKKIVQIKNDTLPSIVNITEPYSSSSDNTIIWDNPIFLKWRTIYGRKIKPIVFKIH